jgi:hypothetical protein
MSQSDQDGKRFAIANIFKRSDNTTRGGKRKTHRKPKNLKKRKTHKRRR